MGTPAELRMTEPPIPIAFYDFDGTLASSNIVTRYAYLVRRLPQRARAYWKLARLIASVPGYLALDHISRSRFNLVFFKEYRGTRQDWLEGQAQELFDEFVRPSIYAGARELVAADRNAGYRPVLVSGELDFVLRPAVRYFGFDGLISNALIFDHGVATGEVNPPLIAEQAKVNAMVSCCGADRSALRRAKAYSDSFSDVPMLEAVGIPCAVNPDHRLRAAAEARGWPVRDLRRPAGKAGFDRGDHVNLP